MRQEDIIARRRESSFRARIETLIGAPGVNEFAGRSNVRTNDTIDQMGEIVTGLSGKRLRYSDFVPE